MHYDYVNCLTCESQFKPVKSKANKFCSMTCYRAFQRNGNYKNIRPSRRVFKCTHCDSEVIGKSKSRDRNKRKSENIFCNRDCYDAYRAKIKVSDLPSCIACGKTVADKNKKYCSLDCSKLHRKSRDRHCIVCDAWFCSLKWNSSIWRLVSDKNRKTCSHECYTRNIKENQSRKEKISDAFSGQNHPNWLGGESFTRHSFRGSNWKMIRKAIIKRDGFKCKHCGIGQEDHLNKYNCDFNVNHIKPFFQFGGNTELANKPSNLETLCKSCHTKADWKYRKENQIQFNLF